MEQNGIMLEEIMVAALETLEGLKERVCPVIDIQKSTAPLVVYDQNKENDQKTLSGNAGLLLAAYQVHVLHNTYLKMRQLAEQVKSALEALQGHQESLLLVEAVTVELGSPDLLESKVQLFRRTYNVLFNYQIKEE